MQFTFGILQKGGQRPIGGSDPHLLVEHRYARGIVEEQTSIVGRLLLAGLGKLHFASHVASDSEEAFLVETPQAKVQLTGTVTSAKTVLSPPASRMSDEDIATLAQIRQSIESVWKMIQSAAQTTN